MRIINKIRADFVLKTKIYWNKKVRHLDILNGILSLGFFYIYFSFLVYKRILQQRCVTHDLMD